jgi:predicted hydrocarbon binding protein
VTRPRVRRRVSASRPVLDELIDDGDGRITYRNHRYLLIRPETLAELRRAVGDVAGERAAECFAAAGRAGGAGASRLLDGDRAARVRQLLGMGTAIGWGRFELEELTTSTLIVAVHGSPFAEALGPAPGPVCDLIRGVLESLTAVVFEGLTKVCETECEAAGAGVCRFEARAG